MLPNVLFPNLLMVLRNVLKGACVRRPGWQTSSCHLGTFLISLSMAWSGVLCLHLMLGA